MKIPPPESEQKEEQIPAEVANSFTVQSPEDLSPINWLVNQLKKLKATDVWITIILRVIFVGFFLTLLFWQNRAVFTFITTALKTKQISSIQPILAVVVGGTLTETYLVVRLMVQFVFRDIDYGLGNKG